MRQESRSGEALMDFRVPDRSSLTPKGRPILAVAFGHHVDPRALTPWRLHAGNPLALPGRTLPYFQMTADLRGVSRHRSVLLFRLSPCPRATEAGRDGRC